MRGEFLISNEPDGGGKTPIILNGGSATAPKIPPRESHIHICKQSDYKCKHLVYICNFWAGCERPPAAHVPVRGTCAWERGGRQGGGRSPPTNPINVGFFFR